MHPCVLLLSAPLFIVFLTFANGAPAKAGTYHPQNDDIEFEFIEFDRMTNVTRRDVIHPSPILRPYGNAGIYQLTTIQNRAATLVSIGAFFSDMATMQIHGIYDQVTITTLAFYNNNNPLFQPLVQSPFFPGYAPGNISYYGQLMAWVSTAFINAGPEATLMAPELAKLIKSCDDPALCFLDENEEQFLSCEAAGESTYSYQCGAQNTSSIVFAVALPVTIMFVNDSHMFPFLQSTVAVIENTPSAQAMAAAVARLIQRAILYQMPALEAITETIAELLNPDRLAPFPDDAEIAQGMQYAVGNASMYNSDYGNIIGTGPNGFTSFFLAIQNLAQGNSFANSILENAWTGGDICGRGLLIGSYLLALQNNNVVPYQTWNRFLESVVSYTNDIAANTVANHL